METDYISAFLIHLFWVGFGLLFGFIIGVGSGQLFISLLIGALFGLGLAFLISRHTHKNKHLT